MAGTITRTCAVKAAEIAKTLRDGLEQLPTVRNGVRTRDLEVLVVPDKSCENTPVEDLCRMVVEKLESPGFVVLEKLQSSGFEDAAPFGAGAFAITGETAFGKAEAIVAYRRPDRDWDFSSM